MSGEAHEHLLDLTDGVAIGGSLVGVLEAVGEPGTHELGTRLFQGPSKSSPAPTCAVVSAGWKGTVNALAGQTVRIRIPFRGLRPERPSTTATSSTTKTSG